jgi:hypothetical protein
MRISIFINKVLRAFRHPIMATKSISSRIRGFFSMETIRFWNYYRKCRKPKVWYGVPVDEPRVLDELEKQLKDNGFNVLDYQVDVDSFWEFRNEANYSIYPEYWEGVQINKALQHYLAAEVLELSGDDVYVDIASGSSPAAYIYHRLYGCSSYKQDLCFPEGVHGDTIGGDASNMPVEDGFASKIALHCSFEMFEHDSDILFIKEANRVLASGGKLCIVPLYLFIPYAIQTNPVTAIKSRISFESDATLYCKKDWWRFARFYDVPHLISRVRNNLINLDLTIYILRNEKEIDPTCWIKHFALCQKVK